jgi:AcrR family transcriptional regulator
MATRTQPRSTRQIRVRLDVGKRREQLLALAGRAFSAHRYDEVSTEAIADAAGISHGLLFHYFPTKHALYVAVLRAAADHLVRKACLELQGSPEERLLAGLDAYFSFVEEHTPTYATLLGASLSGDPVAKTIVDETRGTFLSTIGGKLASALRTQADKRIQRAALRGWIGLVEALALDWIDNRALSRAELIATAARALRSTVPRAQEFFGREPRRRESPG